MDVLQTINEHMIIRETCGYDVIKNVEVYDIPNVMQFLTICWNYEKMSNIEKE